MFTLCLCLADVFPVYPLNVQREYNVLLRALYTCSLLLQTYFYDMSEDSLRHRGIGADLAMLDSAYYLAQVMLSALMGYVVHYTGTVVSYVVCASVLGGLSCICILRVICSKVEVTTLVKHNRR